MYNPRKLLRCLTQFRNRRNTGRSRIGNSHFQTFCLCLSHPASKEEGVLSISRRRSKYCTTYLRVCNIVQGSTNWGGWILFAPFNWEWNWGIIYVFNIFYLKLRDLKSNYSLFFLRTRFLHVQRNTNILERVKTCFRLLYTNLTNNLAFEDYTSQISI